MLMMKRKECENFVVYEVVHPETGEKMVLDERVVKFYTQFERNGFHKSAISKCFEAGVIYFRYSEVLDKWYMHFNQDSFPSQTLLFPTGGGSTEFVAIERVDLIETLNELKENGAEKKEYIQVFYRHELPFIRLFSSRVTDYDIAKIVKYGFQSDSNDINYSLD